MTLGSSGSHGNGSYRPADAGLTVEGFSNDLEPPSNEGTRLPRGALMPSQEFIPGDGSLSDRCSEGDYCLRSVFSSVISQMPSNSEIL